jgi:hypothetical protein
VRRVPLGGATTPAQAKQKLDALQSASVVRRWSISGRIYPRAWPTLRRKENPKAFRSQPEQPPRIIGTLFRFAVKCGYQFQTLMKPFLGLSSFI